MITSGELLRGFGNAAGEVGHIVLVAGGRQCRCGNRGCLEAYAGGWAIAERAQEAGRALVALAGDVGRISAMEVAGAFRRGDPRASRLVRETADYLAAGLTGIVNAFNPRVLILGGGAGMIGAATLAREVLVAGGTQ